LIGILLKYYILLNLKNSMKKINKVKEKEIIEKNKGLVFKVIRKYKYRDDYEDIIQEGYIALLKAYRNFNNDIHKGKNWGPFAVKVISQDVKYYINIYPYRIKRHCPFINISLNEKITENDNKELVDIIKDNRINVEIEALNNTELYNCLQKIKNKRDKKILIMRYNKYSLRDIGKELNTSGEWIRQCLLKIKNKLEKQKVI